MTQRALCRTPLTALLLLACMLPAPAHTQPIRVQPTFSWRIRGEHWSYFTAPDADNDYGFVGSTLRFGLAGTSPGFGWTLEGAAPFLLGLPDDAVSANPRGALGLGATYWAENRRERNVAMAFVKQAFVRVGSQAGRSGHAVRLGRFEFAEGNEIASSNASMQTLKRSRIAERLVGPFGWTHVGRSFDGAHYTYDRLGSNQRGPFNVTLAAFAPTEGAFTAHAWRPLEIGVGYGALSFGRSSRAGAATDARLFALHYDDQRDDPRLNKVDNRPAVVRALDRGAVRVTTLGGHLVHVEPTDAGAIDVVAWGAVQGGDWGALAHRAGASALEIGWQPRGIPGRPWLRALWFRSSGDADASDGEHGSFFEVLPTPRPFARFPIHNLMNLDQVGGSLMLRPSPRVTLRADVQSLRLAAATDLWYAGGGAFRTESFGFSGRPSGGSRDLSLMTDLSADFRVTPTVTISAYAARSSAGEVIRAIHSGTGAAYFGYVEFDVRY
jgi:hypothetical protein